MRDQAAGLRDLMAARAVSPSTQAAGPPVVVVGSGKGGVGKSVVSALLAASAAAAGLRVLLLEGEQNRGSLSLLLGVRPTARLSEVTLGGATIDELLTPVTERMWLLPGDSGAEALHGLSPVDHARLHHRLTSVYDRFEAVVVDGGAALESVTRVATMRATRLVAVTTPEPAAMADTYALIKIVHLQAAHVAVHVLVNRITDASEATETFERLQTAAQRFLRRPLYYLGSVPEDPELQRAVRRAVPLLQVDRGSAAFSALSGLGRDRHDLFEQSELTAPTAATGRIST